MLRCTGELNEGRESFRRGRGFSPRCFSVKDGTVGACSRGGHHRRRKRYGSSSFRPEEAWGRSVMLQMGSGECGEVVAGFKLEAAWWGAPIAWKGWRQWCSAVLR